MHIVICVVTDSEGKVLVVKRAKREVTKGGSVLDWTFPSGKIEQDVDATVEDAAAREVREESGCEIKEANFLKEKDHEQAPVKALYVTARLKSKPEKLAGDAGISEVRFVAKDELKGLFGTRIDPDVLRYLGIDAD
jgi:ADP-ribose pyrophosphatase YjhB (NUDIX family)